MKTSGFFITGTDTGIGKTYISRLLVDTFSSQRPTTYMKPVQTGCIEDSNGNLSSPDFDYIMEGKCTLPASLSDHLPYRFKMACSPHLAMSIESNEEISIDRIVRSYKIVAQSEMLTIVEGAGGIMAPLNNKEYMVNLIAALALPVILVSSPHLGTLNHTILSIQALQYRKLHVAGIVMNNVHNLVRDKIYVDNISFIRDYIAPSPLLETGYKIVKEQELYEFCKKLK